MKDRHAPPPDPELVKKYDDLQWRAEHLLALLHNRDYDKPGWMYAVNDISKRIADGAEP